MVESYQDAYYPARSSKGERDCAARWLIVEPYLPPRGMLLDVGSNLGYFGLRATAERPGVAVVSIEADPVIARRQGEIADEHGTGRIAVLSGEVSAESTRTWAESCDWFDLTLLLSILHWVDDPAAVVAALSSMSGRMLCEVPDPADEGACGQAKIAAWANPVAWFESVTDRPCRLVGRMERHTSSARSHVVLVEGPVTRAAARPYWSSDRPEAGPYMFAHDGTDMRFTVRGEDRIWIPGANVHNLMKLGALVSPRPEWWQINAHRELEAHPDHPDPLPHNMIWGPDGIRLVDFEALDALHTPSDGLRTLEMNVTRWARGATVSGIVTLRELTWLHRLRYSRTGRGIFRLLPAPAVRALRSVVRGFASRRF